jgi:hypothetical protein
VLVTHNNLQYLVSIGALLVLLLHLLYITQGSAPASRRQSKPFRCVCHAHSFRVLCACSLVHAFTQQFCPQLVEV